MHLEKKIILLCFILFTGLAIFFWLDNVPNMKKNQSINFFNWDLYTYFYPAHEYTSRELRSGNVPVWNPYQHCGTPHLATQASGVFYPLHFVYLIFPANIAMAVSFVMHVALAGIFMFLFTLSLRMSIFGAFCSGITYMLSGTVLASIYQSNVQGAVAWAPLVFLFAHKTVSEKKLKWAISLGVVVAVQFLSGYMQYFVYTLYGTSLFVIYQMLIIYYQERNPIHIASIISLLLAGSLVCLSISAAQLFPTYELSHMAGRSMKGLSWNAVHIYPPPMFHELFDKISQPQSYKIPFNGYIGIIPFLLALISLFHIKKINVTIFFLILSILAVMLTMSSSVPLYKYYYKLPTGNWFRYPPHFMYLFGLSIPVLVGFGCDFLLTIFFQKEKKPLDFKLYATISIICLISISIISAISANINTVILTSIFLLLLWIIMFVNNLLIKRALFIGTLVVLIIKGLLLGTEINFIHPSINNDLKTFKILSDVIQKNELYRSCFLRDFRTAKYTNNKIFEKNSMIYGLFCIHDHEPFSLKRYGNFFAKINGIEKNSPSGISYSLIPYTGYISFNADSKNIHLINFLSTKYIIVNKNFNFIINKKNEMKFPLLKQTPEFKIYENKNALPRAYFVNQYTLITDEDKILQTLVSPSFNAKDNVILEENPKVAISKIKSRNPVVKIDMYKSNEVQISVKNQNAGFLILTDTFFPGWKAIVNGTEKKIFRANYLVRAVYLEAGNNSIRCYYDPLPYKIGKWISCIALVVLSLISIFYYVNKLKKKE